MRSPFSKAHSEQLSMEGLTPEEFLVIAYDAIHKLGLDVSYLSPHHLVYYTKVSSGGDTEVVSIAIEDKQAVITSKNVSGRLIDFGKNKRNIKEFADAFDELRTSFGSEQLLAKYQALAPLLSADDRDEYSKRIHESGSVKDILSVFVPSKHFFITPLIIDINILVFAIMCFTGISAMAPNTDQLLLWGGDFRPLTIHGEWWRLFTSMFVHGGLFHLLMNLYALLYIGILLEPMLGKARYTAAYILTGICAGLMSVSVHAFTVSVGASGAIFGLYGVFLAMLTTDLIEKGARKAMLQSILVFVGYNLVYGMQGNTDNAGHIGGLLGGILIGYAFVPGLKKGFGQSRPAKVILLLSALVLAAVITTFMVLPDPAGAYQKKMERFAENETKALRVYDLSSDSTSRDTFLYYIDRGLDYWKKNERIMDEAVALDLPDPFPKRNRILKQYCGIRINAYELMYKQVHDSNQAYADKIAEYNEDIRSLLDQLKE